MVSSVLLSVISDGAPPPPQAAKMLTIAMSNNPNVRILIFFIFSSSPYSGNAYRSGPFGQIYPDGPSDFPCAIAGYDLILLNLFSF